MIKIENISFENKTKLYNYLNMKVTGLVCEKNDWLASLANISATIWMLLKDINWAGFYLYKNDEPLPICYVHSENVAGNQNIKKLLKSFKDGTKNRTR